MSLAVPYDMSRSRNLPLPFEGRTLVRFAIGLEDVADLRADIGVDLGPDGRELLFVRSQVVLISAAAGIEPPVGPVDTNFRDLDALRESTRAIKAMGYVGRACIHPAQAGVVNEVFTPTEQEVAAAIDLIARFDAAMAAGDAVCLDAQGRMVDEAVVRQARRVVALAR